MIIGYIISSIFLTFSIYCFYMILRNEKVYSIRIKWIDNDDKRRFKYTYIQMAWPNEDNWFGLRWPKDNHYK